MDKRVRMALDWRAASLADEYGRPEAIRSAQAGELQQASSFSRAAASGSALNRASSSALMPSDFRAAARAAGNARMAAGHTRS
jgi:hypothetical protein